MWQPHASLLSTHNVYYFTIKCNILQAFFIFFSIFFQVCEIRLMCTNLCALFCAFCTIHVDIRMIWPKNREFHTASRKLQVKTGLSNGLWHVQIKNPKTNLLLREPFFSNYMFVLGFPFSTCLKFERHAHIYMFFSNMSFSTCSYTKCLSNFRHVELCF